MAEELNNGLEGIWAFIQQLPLWTYIGITFAGAVLIILWVIIRSKKNKKFVQKIHELAHGQGENKALDSSYLLGKTGLLEELEGKHPGLIEKSGVLPLWAKRFEKRPNLGDMNRLLTRAPEQYLFHCFLGVLTKPSLGKPFLALMEKEGLSSLARQCKGLDFDGAKAGALLSGLSDRLREIAGDPIWQARFFSIQILLKDQKEHNLRVLNEAFFDSHPLIRQKVVRFFKGDQRQSVYEKILNIFLHDASYEVRKAAGERLFKDFSDLHEIDPGKMKTSELLHLMEFPRPGHAQDINLAMTYLEKPNLELRLPCARFLEKEKVLSRLLTEVRFDDQELMARNQKLLSKAVEINVNGFLHTDLKNPASIMLALSLLEKQGPKDLVAPLCQKAFALEACPDALWNQCVKTISSRGGSRPLEILYKELQKDHLDPKRPLMILEKLPPVEEQFQADILMDLLLKENFLFSEKLLELLAKSSPAFFLPQLIEILQGGRDSFSHILRVRALKGVGVFKLPYTIQIILEQLPTLPIDEARAFVEILTHFGSDFEERIQALLEQWDGRIRGAIIASLPEKSRARFSKEIKAAINDPEPEVRIAAVWAFLQGEDTKRWSMTANLLRDPVESVREAAASALGTYGNKKILDDLMAVVQDPNEIFGVKSSALRGLGASTHKSAMEYLVRIYVEGEEDFLPLVQSILYGKKDALSLQFIIEIFKDSGSKAKDRIVELFVHLGQGGEQHIRDLLEGDIPSLKPYLSEILERTGYVESMIRRLGHRKPEQRLEATKFLASLGTAASYRGVVLASRDPNESVRIQVAKALEKLQTKAGKNILEALKEDPDPKVRKYTHWALERFGAKTKEV